MVTGDDKHCVADLDDEAIRRRDQASFHVFAEGEHSDVRGQLYNLQAGGSLALPCARWPNHVFIVLGVRGNLQAALASTTIGVRPLSQIVVLPGVACTLSALSDATVEIVSFLPTRPRMPISQRDGTAIRVAASANVIVPAIRALELRGFEVTREHSDTSELWRARHLDLDVLGDDPLDLLGLVALIESTGPSWQASDDEIADVLQRFDLA